MWSSNWPLTKGGTLENFPTAIAPNEYSFTIRETAHYHVLDGREIIVTPLPEAGEKEIRLFLLGTAWGALCYQRGLLILHASVVKVDGRTLAFSGHSGAGKSTLAASLVQRGGELISDDLCCIQLTETEARVYPSAPRLKLWRSALEHLGLEDASLVQDHFRIDKYHLTHEPAQAPTEALKLDGIYLLEWGEPQKTRLRGQQAVSRLVSTATYHPELIEPLGCTSAHWERCLRLVQLTPVWELRRPKDWAELNFQT